jgi:hypothetical protein
MGNRRERRRAALDDEPVLDEDELEWCGDELIYVVDRTAAGFALGPTVTQMRRAAEHDARGAGWVRAKYTRRCRASVFAKLCSSTGHLPRARRTCCAA